MTREEVAFLRENARKWQIESDRAIDHMKAMYQRLAGCYARLAEEEHREEIGDAMGT
jgi:hypothetical protein